MSHSCLPQSHCLQRTRSLRQPNPLPYFRRFQQNLDVLKQQVQTFNNWENYASAANIVGEKSTHSRRLKRMTEPKYHGTVLRLLVEKERHGDPRQRTDREQRKVSESLVSRQTITDKSQASTGLLQEITGNSNLCLISRTEKVKKGEVRFNVRRKQKILQNQWSKLENYRSQNRIYNAAEALPISKKERLIFSKILQNRKQSSQTPELGENEASFESGLEFLKLN